MGVMGWSDGSDIAPPAAIPNPTNDIINNTIIKQSLKDD